MTNPPIPDPRAKKCMHGHTERKVGCVSCVLVFDELTEHGYQHRTVPDPRAMAVAEQARELAKRIGRDAQQSDCTGWLDKGRNAVATALEAEHTRGLLSGIAKGYAGAEQLRLRAEAAEAALADAKREALEEAATIAGKHQLVGRARNRGEDCWNQACQQIERSLRQLSAQENHSG